MKKRPTEAQFFPVGPTRAIRKTLGIITRGKEPRNAGRSRVALFSLNFLLKFQRTLQVCFSETQAFVGPRPRHVVLTLTNKLFAVEVQPLNVSLATHSDAMEKPVPLLNMLRNIVAQWIQQTLIGYRIPKRGFVAIASGTTVNPVALVIQTAARGWLEVVNRQWSANTRFRRAAVGTRKAEALPQGGVLFARHAANKRSLSASMRRTCSRNCIICSATF